MHLFDTHAHLDDEAFDQDRADVIARAVQAGVQAIVAVATTADGSAACVALASQFDCVLASVGIHPNYCSQALSDDWQRVVDMVGAARAIMLDGAGLRDVAPQIATMTAMTAGFLAIGARIFRWRAD